MIIMKTIEPDVMEKRSDHASISTSNKIFVICGFKILGCEVFDSFSKNLMTNICFKRIWYKNIAA